MKIIIHRGSDEIGGSCIELMSGNSRLILDLGFPIMEHGGGSIDSAKVSSPSIANGILPDIKGLYKSDQPTITGVILSHGHMDHYGLMDYIHPDIPIYLSKGTQKLLETGNIFFPEKLKQVQMMSHVQTFDFWKTFQVGPFKIFAYLMDHSAFDAGSLLIEAGGKRVFYSGDLRAHGRKSKLFQKLVDDPPKDVDCFLMEGTTIGGNHDVGYKTEESVEQKFLQIFRDQKDISFVMSAGSNIDRTISLYKAALRTNKLLILDLYQFFILEQLKASAPNLPPFEDDLIRIYFSSSQAKKLVDAFGVEALYRLKPRHFKREDILQHRKDCVVAISLYEMRKIADHVAQGNPLKDSHFIFSMWQGYLQAQSEFEAFYRERDMTFSMVHCSGHAYLEDLTELADAMDAKKLVPIHTLQGDIYQDHFRNVVRIKNGESLTV